MIALHPTSRRPNKVNATPGGAPFDSQMVEYASIYRAHHHPRPAGRTSTSVDRSAEVLGLFYAGNGYGRTGLGYAETLLKT